MKSLNLPFVVKIYAMAAFVHDDPEKGKKTLGKCKSCHALDVGKRKLEPRFMAPTAMLLEKWMGLNIPNQWRVRISYGMMRRLPVFG